MSKLDQAFLKAYRKSKADRGAISHPHVQPPHARGQAATDPLSGGGLTTVTPPGVRIDSVATVELSAASSSLASAESPIKAVPTPHIVPPRSSSADLAEAVAATSAAQQGLRATTAAVHPPAAEVPPPATKANPPSKPTPATMPPVAPGPLPATAPTAEPEPPQRLRPLFEVERLPWPKVCGSLVQAATKELAHLADEMTAGARAGRKLVLVSSRQRGEGRSTTLLCLARQLSTHGLNIALVDGDFQQAQLVRQVKLLPQAGWENVLRGETPLDEALIEAVEDRITLLPLMAPLIEHEARVCRDQIDASLERLRDQYDLVLVDGPAAEDPAGALDALLEAARFDSAVLVRDVRKTDAGALDVLVRRLAAAGVEHCEIAENFVP
jgi:Mrp family chromosome partitioning ATPase